MNAQELIKNLKTYPGELDVYVRDTRNGMTMELDIYKLESNEAIPEVDEDEYAGVLCDVEVGTKYIAGYVE